MYDVITGDLNPYFIVGFSDAEALFTLSISKDNRERKTTRCSLNNADREFFSIHPFFSCYKLYN